MEQVARAGQVLVEQGGLWPTRLVGQGVDPGAVRALLAEVTGLPIAAAELLRSPGGDVLRGLDRSVFPPVHAAPFARVGDRLLVAFADPDQLLRPEAARLPPHVAHVAMEPEVRAAWDVMAHVVATPSLAAAAAPMPRFRSLAADGGERPPGPVPEAPPPASGAALDRVGDFQTVKPLGRGGMAEVHLARHVETGSQVALKVMLPHLADDAHAVGRFLKEARATMGLSHPNLVQVLTCGESGGQPYMVFEYVDGGTLEQALRRAGRLPPALAVEVVCQVLAGLSHAHAAGVVHRDLKPANLLLSLAGLVKVADFGIAKTLAATSMTLTGMRMGTPLYMSPEQAGSGNVDARSDLYAVGVVLYELLAGANPFQADHAGITLRRIMEGDVTPIFQVAPWVPADLELILERLMATRAEDRFPDATAALAALAPACQRARATLPDAVAALARDPEGMARVAARAQAQAHVRRAQELLKRGPVDRPGAAFQLHRAVLLDGEDAEARSLLDTLCASERFSFAPPTHPRVLELEASLQGPSPSPHGLQQLAQLHRAEGNIHRAALALKRYLRVCPQDGYVQNQVAVLTGDPAVEGLRPPPVAARVVPGGVPVEEPPPGAWWKWLGVGALAFAVLVGVVKGGGEVFRGRALRAVEGGREVARERAEEMRVREQREVDADLEARSALRAQQAKAQLASAEAATRAGDHERALKLLEATVAGFPRREEAARARFLRGKALLALDRPVDARDALGEFLDTHPGHADAREAQLRKGEAEVRMRYTTAAMETLGALLRDEAEGPWAAEALVLRGEAHAERGLTAEAASDFRAAQARAGPGSPLHTRASRGLAALPGAAASGATAP
jgi:serine/threonine-protein kinase